MDDKTIREHLGQMEKALASSPTDIPALGRLIATLEQHCSIIPGGDETWKPTFWEHWSCLEEVYAVALDRGMTGLDEESSKIVGEAIAGLQAALPGATSTVG